MAIYVKLEGFDSAMRGLERMPSKVLNATKASMRAAGRKAVAEIRKAAPPRFKSLVKSKLTKGKLSSDSYLTLGYFWEAPTKEKDVSDWFKAYWQNYGTLKHRDPNHKFKYPIKHEGTTAAHRRRNNEGQPKQGSPARFYERGLAAAVPVFQRTFEEQMDKRSKKLLEP